MARLTIEPGAGPGKDKYFDNEQLREQQRLAQEVFECSHFAPARDVALLDATQPVDSVTLGISEAGAPRGRCASASTCGAGG